MISRRCKARARCRRYFFSDATFFAGAAFLVETAHLKRTALIGARHSLPFLIWRSKMRIEAREDDPGHTELMLEALEICGLKIPPSALGIHFLEPARSEARDAGSHAAIFFIVGERAAFGERAESVIILARQRHVVRIEREQAVDWSILPDPGEGLQPFVLRRDAGQLQMRGRRIHLALGIEHDCTQRNKKQDPAIDTAVEYIAAEEAAHDQEEQQVEQVQVAHRLKRPQALEAGRKHDQETDGSLEGAIKKEARNERRQPSAVALGFFAIFNKYPIAIQ